MHKLQTSGNKSVHKLLTSCVRMHKSSEQLCNKLLTTWNKSDGIIRFVAMLFQQDWYSHDITIWLQPCDNLVTTGLYQSC